MTKFERFYRHTLVCIRCKKYGHHVTKCRKKEKDKERKEETKKIDIKPVSLQDLMTKAKMVKQEIKEIKEENSIDINEQNIVEIINFKEFSNATDRKFDDDDGNKQNYLSLINRIIFQK